MEFTTIFWVFSAIMIIPCVYMAVRCYIEAEDKNEARIWSTMFLLFGIFGECLLIVTP